MKKYNEFINENIFDFLKKKEIEEPDMIENIESDFNIDDVFRIGDHADNRQEISNMIKDFIILGDWYRIKFPVPDYKKGGFKKQLESIVIKSNNCDSLMTRDVAISYQRMYKNGNFQEVPADQRMMDGISGCMWISTYSNYHYDRDGSKYEKKRWEDYYSKIVIEHLIRKDDNKNIDVDPLGEEDWDD